jgi:hypothetical protein
MAGHGRSNRTSISLNADVPPPRGACLTRAVERQPREVEHRFLPHDSSSGVPLGQNQPISVSAIGSARSLTSVRLIGVPSNWKSARSLASDSLAMVSWYLIERACF